MKRIYSCIIIMLLCAATASAQKTKELVILHTNDAHSCIFPLSENLADTMLAGRGGFLRRLNMVKEERKKHPNLLLIDSGDFSQGSTYYTLFKGDVEVGLMNQMGYDAITIGNHEFDFGMENMARLFMKCNFPIVCSNYDFAGTTVEGLVKPYTVIEKDGIRVGLFGLSPQMDGLVAGDNWKGVKFLDPVEKANEMADILRNQEDCDLVVCVSHLGWTTSPDYLGDNTLVPQTRGIDIILGGHSHTYMKEIEYVKDLDGREVAIEQNGKHALYVGKIKFEFSERE